MSQAGSTDQAPAAEPEGPAAGDAAEAETTGAPVEAAIEPAVGAVIFAAASILKDTVNRIGDLADDGKVNQSFRS